MKTIQANCGQALPLGRLGENEYTAISFDVSAWLAEYPNAEIQLYNQRPTESASYPISNITVTGGVAKWVVTNTELAKTGQGKCQLAAISGDVIAKSRIFETLVFDALDGGGDVPEPMEDWQQIFVDLKDATEAAAQEAQGSAEAAAASAELAEGYAEQAQAAQSAAEAAQAAKTGAETAAGNAATSATSAANSATQAAQSASNANTSAGQAQTSATAAGQSASSAAQSATAAEAAKDTITGMSVEAETLPAGSSATASWADGTLSLGIPQGSKGDKGDTGDSGVYVGTTQPTDPDVNIWLDPSGTQTVHGVPAGGTTGQVLTKASGTDYDTEWADPSGGDVTDVQVNGVSVLDAQGVANVPIASTTKLGVIGINPSWLGFNVNSNGLLYIEPTETNIIKAGTNGYRVVPILKQHESTFYGLAKAAGDTTQSASSNAVGTYTETAKSKISEMLNGSVTVSGTTPTIAAKAGIQYVCGEVATLDITLPESGIVDVVFTSGATPTVLTVTPPSGVTVKWANGFDPDNLDANTTYEINIADGLGVAGQWT